MIGLSADRRHVKTRSNLHEASQCFCRVAVSSRGRRQAEADLHDSAIRGSFESDATNRQTVGLTPDLVVAERTLLTVLLSSAQKVTLPLSVRIASGVVGAQQEHADGAGAGAGGVDSSAGVEVEAFLGPTVSDTPSAIMAGDALAA